MATKKIPTKKVNQKQKTQAREDKDKENKKKSNHKRGRDSDTLTEKEKKFVEAYLEHGNQTQASKDAGYKYKTDASHAVNANHILKKDKVKKLIDQYHAQASKKSIATAQEVMEYFTKVMNGEINDQFGLEAPLSERTRAAQELAKRTVDWEARKAGQADATLNIKLDFNGL